MARTWREKALSVSIHYGAGRDEAEDIAQDVMLRLWQMHQELERFQSVEAIVSLMARHMLRNHQRRKPTEALSEAVALSLTASPHEELEDKENYNKIHLTFLQPVLDAVQNLREDQEFLNNLVEISNPQENHREDITGNNPSDVSRAGTETTNPSVDATV